MNVDLFLFRPVLAGIWSHAEAVGDAFTFDDLLDAHEILDLKEENERRARAAAERR